MISHLGRYEIIGELGQGAMGLVYKAKDPLIDRPLAIKTISLNLAMEEDKAEYEARFYQEAKAAGSLSHPNIVTIYDVGKSGDVAYIAMEFLQGRELRDVLNEYPLLPIDQVLDIVVQVAQGLAYAHEHGIVHRDVKPANIMVVRDGHVKITDFGIARMASASVRTQTGMVLGSPKYMSPEQVLGKTIDQRTDIFSLGVMLYEMLTGQQPFVGDTINAIMYQTINTVPRSPNALNPAVPAMLNFIVAKALAKNPDDRYRDAEEFANDLRACRDTVPRSATRADLRRGRLRQPDAQLTAPIQMIRRGEAGVEDSEELGKTLKITRSSPDTINQTAKPKAAPAPITRTIPLQASKGKRADAPRSASNSKLLLTLIALLVLLVLVLIL